MRDAEKEWFGVRVRAEKRRARKPRRSESNIGSEISGKIYNNKEDICAPHAVCEARRKFLREVDVLPACGGGWGGPVEPTIIYVKTI